MAARIFAVSAAILLVLAIGLATLFAPGLALGQALLMLDRGALEALRSHAPGFAWSWLITPFLLRPLWLVPACLGLVCAGIAVSCSMARPAQSRRRRS